MRTTVIGLLVLALVAPAAAAGSSALYRKYKGQIVVSDQPLPVLDDEKDMIVALKKASKATLERRKGAESWSFHLMGFLTKKPGVGSLSLMIYDVGSGKRKYLTNKEITVEPNATILATDVEITDDDGVKPGMKIEIVLSKFAGSRQTDFAKTKLTFK